MIRASRLSVSTGHNYFDHHGPPAGRHPPVETGRTEGVAGRGTGGDRFLDVKVSFAVFRRDGP